MRRITKSLNILLWVIFLVLFLFFSKALDMVGGAYFIEILLLIFSILTFKLNYYFTLRIAFWITAIGGIINIFNQFGVPAIISETVLRFSLSFWLAGIVQVLIYYKTNKKD